MQPIGSPRATFHHGQGLTYAPPTGRRYASQSTPAASSTLISLGRSPDTACYALASFKYDPAFRTQIRGSAPSEAVDLGVLNVKFVTPHPNNPVSEDLRGAETVRKLYDPKPNTLGLKY